MKTDLREELVIPEKVTIEIGPMVIISSARETVEKKLVHPKIKIQQEGHKLILTSGKASKKEKKMFNTFVAHLKNMLKGIVEKHVYKLKICSGHFPMNVSVSDGCLVIKNFMGEHIPRKVKIKKGVEVKVEGNEIIITSPSKEAGGQVAADIEQLTRIRKKDIRIFQDGCYIIQKSEKTI